MIDEFISVYGNDRVGIKLSPGGGYNDMGMSEKDTNETYGHLIKELNKRRVVYIQLSRYWGLGDPIKRGRDVDIFQWNNLIDRQHTALFTNTNYSAEEGSKTLESGLADAIVFGRLYISNPDLAERLINNQELNSELDFRTMYSFESGAKGYTDYPTYAQQKRQ